MAIKIAIFVDFLTVLLISANTGQYQMQNIHVQNISISWRWCGAQLRIHQFYKFAKPPHVSNHHQNITLQFLDFHLPFSYLPTQSHLLLQSIETQHHQRCSCYFLYSIYSTLIFCSYLEFWCQPCKKMDLTWRNLTWQNHNS